MKITFDWLKDHLKTNLKEKNLLEQLTNVGLEVEGVQNLSSDKELFIVAIIFNTSEHTNADRLKVCVVNIGDKLPMNTRIIIIPAATGIFTDLAMTMLMLNADKSLSMNHTAELNSRI